MNPVRPVPDSAAWPMFSWALSRAASVAPPWKPAPGVKRFAGQQPERQGDDRHEEEVAERPQGEAAGPRHVAERADG